MFKNVILSLILSCFSASINAKTSVEKYDLNHLLDYLKKNGVVISVVDMPIGMADPITTQYEKDEDFKKRYKNIDKFVEDFKKPKTKYEKYVMANAIASIYNTFYYTNSNYDIFVKEVGMNNLIISEYERLLACKKPVSLFVKRSEFKKYIGKNEKYCSGSLIF